MKWREVPCAVAFEGAAATVSRTAVAGNKPLVSTGLTRTSKPKEDEQGY
jgi:hypothetical protein